MRRFFFLFFGYGYGNDYNDFNYGGNVRLSADSTDCFRVRRRILLTVILDTVSYLTFCFRNFREDLLSTLDWSTAYCNAQVSSGKERSKKALMDFGNIWCSFETRKKGEGKGKGDSASSVYVSMTLVFIFATISLTQTHFLT